MLEDDVEAGALQRLLARYLGLHELYAPSDVPAVAEIDDQGHSVGFLGLRWLEPGREERQTQNKAGAASQAYVSWRSAAAESS